MAFDSAPLLFLYSRHAFLRKKIKNLIVLDEVHTLGVKADKVRAVFSVFVSNTGINTVSLIQCLQFFSYHILTNHFLATLLVHYIYI